MLDVKKLLTKILGCLYIYGTDGYWTWKKYADGTFEMTRSYSGVPVGSSHYTTVGGFYAYYITGWNFPAACKPISREAYVVHTDWEIGSGFAINAGTVGGTTTSFNTYALASAASQSTVKVRVHVVGKWK